MVTLISLHLFIDRTIAITIFHLSQAMPALVVDIHTFTGPLEQKRASKPIFLLGWEFMRRSGRLDSCRFHARSSSQIENTPTNEK